MARSSMTNVPMATAFRLVPLIGVLIVALLATACGQSPESAMEKSRVHMEKADVPAAILQLKSLLQEQPGHGEARLLLAQAFYAAQALEDAEKECRQALRLGISEDRVLPLLAKTLLRMDEPDKVLALPLNRAQLSPQTLAALHSARAQALLARKDPDGVARELAAAVAADAGHPDTMLLRARQALAGGEGTTAHELIEQALRRDPRHVESLYMLAALRVLDQRDQDALTLYQRIVTLEPTQFAANLAIAGLKQRMGDLAGAMAAVDAARRTAPNHPLVNHALASLQLARGNLRAAHAAGVRALGVAPDLPRTMQLQAAILFAMGDYEHSRNLAKKVFSHEPNNLDTGLVLAASHLRLRDSQAALETLQSLAKRHGDDPRLLGLLGEVHLTRGEHGKAMDYLTKAATLAPDNPAIQSIQARGHAALGDNESALASLKQAARLSRGTDTAQLAQVALYLRGHAYDQALAALDALAKERPATPAFHHLRANAMLGKNVPAAARTDFEKALALDPKFFPAALGLARLDIGAKRYDEARKRLRNILAESQGNQPTLMALADLAAQEHKSQDQLGWLDLALKADPRALPPRIRLVHHHLSRGDKAKALHLAEEAYSWDPDNPRTLLLQGETQLAAGETEAALTSFRILVRKAPDLPEAHLGLARVQLARKNLQAALASLRTALARQPDHLASLEALLRLEQAQGRGAEALTLARRIQDLHPDDATGHAREGDLLFQQRRYAEAATAYQHALERQGGANVLVSYHRALVLASKGEDADRVLADWLARHPDDPAVLGGAAETNMLSGRHREAIGLFESLARLRPRDAAIRNNLALLYARTQDPRALDTAREALQLAEDNPYVRDTLGWILLERGDLDGALAQLGPASRGAPGSGTVRYHHGVALLRSGNRDAARTELKAAVDTGQPFPEMAEARRLLAGL